MSRKNPLAAHLKKVGITQADFARTLSAHVGWRVSRSQVCRWAAGSNRPSRPWRLYIAQATHGEVPADVW